MGPTTRIAIAAILIVAVVIGAIFAISYFASSRNYITTDNAQIDGDQIVVTAPATGTLVDWEGKAGTTFRQNDVIGRIRIQAGFVQPLMSIRAPADGTVAVDHGVPGAFVAAGTQLATAYNLNNIFVTARIQETEINDVQPGQAVDISVDAFASTKLTGHVDQIEDAAAGVFSLLPQSNSSGNFQKVTQVVPVKIMIDDPRGLPLVPGENCTVKIHKS
jgi:multidrug resistance efflux pump